METYKTEKGILGDGNAPYFLKADVVNSKKLMLSHRDRYGNPHIQ